jgi:hypothetical protein
MEHFLFAGMIKTDYFFGKMKKRIKGFFQFVCGDVGIVATYRYCCVEQKMHSEADRQIVCGEDRQ